ncbi:hypothetical protein [Microbulbifer sp. MLAF003]|uniref:hypothetical protein n=1 Tax=Microbulbifer sp. MLAF003 TaxID=3032582 RepID=UPI00333E1956
MNHSGLNNNDMLTEQRQKRGIRVTIAILLLFIVAVLVGFVHKLSQPRVITDSELRLNGAVKLQKARILDNFQLVSDTGEVFHTDSLKGQWTLVFLVSHTAQIFVLPHYPL